MPKKLRFLIIEQARKENHTDLVRAIEESGYEACWFRLEEVVLRTIEGVMTASFGGRDLREFDIVMARTVSSNLRLGRFVLELCHPKQFVLDRAISKRDTFGKISQAATLLAIPLHHPETFYTSTYQEFKKQAETIPFPCIAKPVKGSQGRGVLLLKNVQEALELFPTFGEDYLFQEYLPLTFDYRVFVVGKKILGTMRRFVVPNDIRSNVSLGAKTEEAPTTHELRRVALQAAAAFGYDVAGVDIAVVNGKHYVLEVNRTPQWQGLKKALHIDPAKAIVEFCLRQHARLQK